MCTWEKQWNKFTSGHTQKRHRENLFFETLDTFILLLYSNFHFSNRKFLAWKLIFLHHVVHSKMQFHFGSWHDAMAAFKRLNQIPRGNEMILRKMKLFECCWFGPSPLVISVHQLPVLQAMQKHQAKVRQSSFQTSIVIRKDNKILLEATFTHTVFENCLNNPKKF